MNPFWEKGEPIERNFEPILKLYQNWLSFTKNTAEKNTFSAVFFYPSRRLGISSPHEVRWISSALWAGYHHALACIPLRLDDIQCSALMIYRNRLWMIYKACALIL